MIKFKGFEDWIPIFQGGKQTDSTGKEHDGNALIDQAVAGFNAAAHEPPVCIGHPADDAPAYGWVESLKKQGNLLLAKFRQIQPEFGQMVQQGLFKKRSAAFYPNGTLRHVAFLGAMPPAVKGLPDVAFAEGEATSFEFSEGWTWASLADVMRRLREWIIEEKGQDTANRIIPDDKIETLRSAAIQAAGEDAGTEDLPSPANCYQEQEDEAMTLKERLATIFSEVVAKIPDDTLAATAGGQFSEADIEAAKKTAAEEAAKQERGKVTAEFAEAGRISRHDARKAEVAAWCDRMLKEGKLTPSMVKFGIPEMLTLFAEKEDIIEFGEAKEKATLFARFQDLFEKELPKLITFGEVATREKDAGGIGTAGDKVEALITAKIKDKKELSYSAAFAEVQTENPDLAKEYMAEVQGK